MAAGPEAGLQPFDTQTMTQTCTTVLFKSADDEELYELAGDQRERQAVAWLLVNDCFADHIAFLFTMRSLDNRLLHS